jgi:hypothetical protein
VAGKAEVVVTWQGVRPAERRYLCCTRGQVGAAGAAATVAGKFPNCECSSGRSEKPVVHFADGDELDSDLIESEVQLHSANCELEVVVTYEAARSN